MTRNRNFRTGLVVAALAALSLASTACNTVKGLGRDIESVGQAGSDAL